MSALENPWTADVFYGQSLTSNAGVWRTVISRS